MCFKSSGFLLTVILWGGLFLPIARPPAAPASAPPALVAAALFVLRFVLGVATLFVLRLVLDVVFLLFPGLLPGAALLPGLILGLVLLLAGALVLGSFSRGPAA